MLVHEPFDRSLRVEGQFERILAGFEGYGFSFERSGFGLKVRASFRTSTCNLPNQRSFIRCERLQPPRLYKMIANLGWDDSPANCEVQPFFDISNFSIRNRRVIAHAPFGERKENIHAEVYLVLFVMLR